MSINFSAVLSLLAAPFVLVGQEIAFHDAQYPEVESRAPVVESGDLTAIPQSVAQAKSVTEETQTFHFFEGFVSKTNQDLLLDLVHKYLLQDPDKACEIVKEAIVVSEADEDLVALIVETACEALPEKMRIIAQCAMAVSPNSLHRIQQVLAKLDPGGVDIYFDGKSGLEKGGMDSPESGEVQGVILDTSPINNPIPQIPPDIPTISPPPTTNINPAS